MVQVVIGSGELTPTLDQSKPVSAKERLSDLPGFRFQNLNKINVPFLTPPWMWFYHLSRWAASIGLPQLASL